MKLIIALGVLAGCLPKGHGIRDQVPGDRSGKLEGSFACQEPIALRIAGGELRQAPAGESIALYDGASGPLLLEGKQTITQHRPSPEGDRFFVWYSALSAETLVTPTRSLAIRRGFEGGGDEPRGVPYSIATCVPLEAYAKRASAHVPGMGARGAVPSDHQKLRRPARMTVRDCRVPGAATTVPGAQIAWMPNHILVLDPSHWDLGVYVVFGEPRLTQDEVHWMVAANEKGELDFDLGAVSYAGIVGFQNGKLTADVDGLEPTTKTNLRCHYVER